jgi:hypothetical protein
MLHGMALYLVTLHYITENGNPDSRRLTISAEIEAEAVARAREQFSRLSPPPRPHHRRDRDPHEGTGAVDHARLLAK